MSPMFFNVKDVREYLLEDGLVYTLRKKRWRVGNDIAVKGSRHKHVTIAKIFIQKTLSKPITSWEQLIPYVKMSGLYKNIQLQLTTQQFLEIASKRWLELAQKLSRDVLYLYKISIRVVKK